MSLSCERGHRKSETDWGFVEHWIWWYPSNSFGCTLLTTRGGTKFDLKSVNEPFTLFLCLFSIPFNSHFLKIKLATRLHVRMRKRKQRVQFRPWLEHSTTIIPQREQCETPKHGTALLPYDIIGCGDLIAYLF